MVARIPDAAVWRQIVAEMREQILTGELPPGTGLRSEVQLAHHYQVGIGTIRRAMLVLRFDGLVVGEQGEVARVAERPERRLVRVDPADGPQISCRRATERERRQLDIPEGVWVIEVTHGGFTDLYAADRTTITMADT